MVRVQRASAFLSIFILLASISIHSFSEERYLCDTKTSIVSAAAVSASGNNKTPLMQIASIPESEITLNIVKISSEAEAEEEIPLIYDKHPKWSRSTYF